MSKLSIRVLLPTIAVLLLGACGGGGGSPSVTPMPEPTPQPPPTLNSIDVAAAWHNYLTMPFSWSMPGKEASGRAFEIAVETKPGPPGTFSMTGSSGPTLNETLRLTLTGANTVSSNDTLFFANDQLLGFALDNGGCELPRQPLAALPHASVVGASGPLFTVDGFAGCSVQGQKLGTTIHTWSVQTDSNVLMFCMNAQEQSADGTPIGSNLLCVEASANGTLGTRAKFSMIMPDGSTLNGRNF